MCVSVCVCNKKSESKLNNCLQSAIDFLILGWVQNFLIQIPFLVPPSMCVNAYKHIAHWYSWKLSLWLLHSVEVKDLAAVLMETEMVTETQEADLTVMETETTTQEEGPTVTAMVTTTVEVADMFHNRRGLTMTENAALKIKSHIFVLIAMNLTKLYPLDPY